jgi:hypothetical protein
MPRHVHPDVFELRALLRREDRLDLGVRPLDSALSVCADALVTALNNGSDLRFLLIREIESAIESLHHERRGALGSAPGPVHEQAAMKETTDHDAGDKYRHESRCREQDRGCPRPALRCRITH